MGLTMVDFQEAAKVGGRIALIIDKDNQKSVRGTGQSWSVRGGSRKDCREYVESEKIETPGRWKGITPERQVDLHLRFLFKEVLRKTYGDEIGNLVIRDLRSKYKGFLTALEVKEANNLGWKYMGIKEVNQALLVPGDGFQEIKPEDLSLEFIGQLEAERRLLDSGDGFPEIKLEDSVSEKININSILERSFEAIFKESQVIEEPHEQADQLKIEIDNQSRPVKGMDKETAQDPDVQAFFKTLADRFLIQRSGHHSQRLNGQDIEREMEKHFTDLLRKINGLYGEDSMVFIKMVNQHQKNLPKETSAEDREFLMTIVLHPSLAGMPSKDRSDAVASIMRWYFNFPEAARQTNTLWALEKSSSTDTEYDRQVKHLSISLRNDRRDPKEIFAGLQSTEEDYDEAVPILVNSIRAEEIRNESMPKGLNKKEKEAYSHLTRIFLTSVKDPLEAYRDYVQFVAENIHIIALLKKEKRSIHQVGEGGYESIKGRIEKAMKGPHDLWTYNEIIRADLAGKLAGKQKEAFLNLTDRRGILYPDSFNYSAYLFLIYEHIGNIMKELQDKTDFNWNDLEKIWQIVTNQKTPDRLSKFDFVSELLQKAQAEKEVQVEVEVLDKENPSRPNQQPRVPKQVVLKIIQDVNDLGAQYFKGQSSPEKWSSELQQLLCQTVFPLVSMEDPAFIHGFIRGLLERQAALVKDPNYGGGAFETLIGEITKKDTLMDIRRLSDFVVKETTSLAEGLPDRLDAKDRTELLKEYQGRLCVALFTLDAWESIFYYKGLLNDMKEPLDLSSDMDEVKNSAFIFENMLTRLFQADQGGLFGQDK